MTEAETMSRRSIGAARNPQSEEAILDAATAILAEAGYARFSIEAVARRAKAGKPTIYRWWPSKAHLLIDVYKRLKNVLPDPDTGSVHGDIVMFLDNLTAFWSGSAGDVFRSLLAEAQVDEKAAAALRNYSLDRVEHTSIIFERAKARGEVRQDVDSRAATHMLSAFAWKLLLTGRLQTSHDEIRSLADILTRGVLK
jgi:AcrR family transcriptional regulator